MSPLRIGIDGRELVGAATGVGRYLGELLTRWTARSDSAMRRFTLYTPEPLTLPLPPDTVQYRVIRARNRPGRGTWWEQLQLRRAVAEDRPNVFFAPANTAPLLAGIPVALTIHDVAFVTHPEWFRFREGFRRRWLTRRSADRAAVLFTVSEFSRSEIATHFHVDPSRLHVIRHGITTPEKPTDLVTREPMVLFVGSIFNRRRLPDLVAAFAKLSRQLPNARLVIVGDDRSWPPQSLPAVVASFGVQSRVELKSYVSNAELAALYRRASVFAFLSEYEGFGLTPLEALAANTPIVVADTPIAREIYGAAAHFVPLGNVDATADALARLLREPASASDVMRHAPEVLARYSWDRAAGETLIHIERVARR